MTMMNTLATDKLLYGKEEKLLAVQKDNSEIWTGEVENIYYITMYNQETTEEMIISILSRERGLTESIRKKEIAKRERAVQIVAQIFWQYPERTMWMNVQQLNQQLKMEDIQLLAVEYIEKNFQKTQLFPRVTNAEIGRQVFQTGVEYPNRNICSLQK